MVVVNGCSICFLDVVRNCNVSTVMPMFSVYWSYILTLYVSLG